jgi:hypothetical protein
MDIVLSPIGLGMCIYDRPQEAGLVEGEIVFSNEIESQVLGDFFGVNHLVYRIRPPPRPP